MPSDSEFLNIIISAKDKATSNLKEVGEQLKETGKNAGKASNGLSDLLNEVKNLKKEIKSKGAGLGEVQEDLEETSKSAISTGTSFKKFKGFIGPLIVSLGALAIVVKSITTFKKLSSDAFETAQAFEQLEIKLDGLTKGKGKETLQELSDWSLDMRIGVKQATSIFQDMVSNGIDPALKKMELLVDVSRTFGNEAAPRISSILGDMSRAGKVSASQIDELSKFGINARDVVQQAFQYSIEDLENSGIEIEKIIDEIWKAIDASKSGAGRKAAGSWQSMTDSLQAYWQDFQKQVMDTEIYDVIKAGLQLVLDQIVKMKKEGDFSKWAAIVADRVLQSFGLIAQGIGTLKVAFKGLDFLYNAFSSLALRADLKIKENQLKNTEEAIQLLMDKKRKISDSLSKLTKKAEEGDDSADLNKGIDSLERMLVTIRQSIKAREITLERQVEENNLLAEEINLHDQITKEIASGISPVAKMKSLFLDLRLSAKAFGEDVEKGVESTKKVGGKKGTAVAFRPTDLAKSKSLFEKISNDIELELIKIQSLYDNSGLSLQEYFDRRAEQLKKGYDTEVNYLKKQKESIPVKEQDKRLEVEDKVNKVKVKYAIDEKKLNDERVKAEQDLASIRESIDIGILEKRIELEEEGVADFERILGMKLELMKKSQRQETAELITQKVSDSQLRETFRLQELERDKFAADERKKIADKQVQYETSLQQRRLSVSQDSGNLQQIFALETDLMKRKHEAEIEALEGHEQYKGQIEDTYRMQRLEKDKLAADQRLEVERKTFEGVTMILGDMNSAFGDLYDASGQKVKAYFQIQKAISVAQTIMSTYEAAQNAYKSLSGIPYVGPALGIAAAATATAAGLARVAAIRAQSYAIGGEVKGYSPHKKADNIKANVTAGEYIHPVDAVQKYGVGFMESIRNLSFPKRLISGMSFPVPKLQYASSYAEGGPVTAGPKGMGISTSINVNVNSAGGEDSRKLGKDVSRAVKIEFNKNLQEQMRVGGLLYARR